MHIYAHVQLPFVEIFACAQGKLMTMTERHDGGFVYNINFKRVVKKIIIPSDHS